MPKRQDWSHARADDLLIGGAHGPFDKGRVIATARAIGQVQSTDRTKPANLDNPFVGNLHDCLLPTYTVVSLFLTTILSSPFVPSSRAMKGIGASGAAAPPLPGTASG